MTLGNVAKAELRLIVWCRDCGDQVEPDLAQLAGGTVPTRPSLIGASGWCAANATAGMLILS
jgi:hypothetical protein